MRTRVKALGASLCALHLLFGVHGSVLYVSAGSTNPVAPYAAWDTAAPTIQDAVDAAVDGDRVIVTNGSYGRGGRAVYGALTNRVAITKAITVQSVNGPGTTLIDGGGAGRCAYLTNGALLVGFTLTRGKTLDYNDAVMGQSGGGVWCSSSSAVVSNCVLCGNTAYSGGGGAYQGTLSYCTVLSNTAAVGGGACQAALSYCTVLSNRATEGGGAFRSSLTASTITGNVATNYGMSSYGGGVYQGTLNKCMLTSNSCAYYGGGAYYATLTNSYVVGNNAFDGGGAYGGTALKCRFIANRGGGTVLATVYNSLLSSNTAAAGAGASSGVLNNCIISDNVAMCEGGGVVNATINNCAITGNRGSIGGGAYWCTGTNCTISANTATQTGGGTYECTLNNSIVYYNQASAGSNYVGGMLRSSCTSPMPTNGAANITLEPQLASGSHLNPGSPCRGAGRFSYVTGQDIDGEPWSSPPSMGCDEYKGSATGPLQVGITASYTYVPVGFPIVFGAQISGQPSASAWDFGDGTILSNTPCCTHSWSGSGLFPVTLRAYNDNCVTGVSCSVSILVVTQLIHFVSAASTNPIPPFRSWGSAARDIQAAIDAATIPGAAVLVSNGVYETGGRVAYGSLTNRVCIYRPLTVASVNGPAVTVIKGRQVPFVSNGDAAVRCAYVTNNARLEGFTLTSGATRAYGGDALREYSGGGVWCESNAVVSGCVAVGNVASAYGGGVAGGVLNDCTIISNSAPYGGGGWRSVLNRCSVLANFASQYGGGCAGGMLSNCVLAANQAQILGGGVCTGMVSQCVLSNNTALQLGGGAWQSTLTACLVMSNWAGNAGGGLYGGVAKDCALARNVAYQGGGECNTWLSQCVLTNNTGGSTGGGACWGTLNNCTLTGNRARTGGGSEGGVLNNCIVYYNSANTGSNYDGGTLNYCCTAPAPATGVGNITNSPGFADLPGGNLRLGAGSSCINSGRNSFTTNAADLDGNARIAGGTVDVGAYEFQDPASVISYAWLQQNGLAVDGSADFADADSDGMNNWQEWLCGTGPNDPSSLLWMFAPVQTGAGLELSWQSVSGKPYFVQRSAEIGSGAGFGLIQSNIIGGAGITTFVDTNAVGGGPYFYRVGVQRE